MLPGFAEPLKCFFFLLIGPVMAIIKFKDVHEVPVGQFAAQHSTTNALLAGGEARQRLDLRSGGGGLHTRRGEGDVPLEEAQGRHRVGQHLQRHHPADPLGYVSTYSLSLLVAHPLCETAHDTQCTGGFKQSGHGRDMSEYALAQYTAPKCVIIEYQTPKM
jgi:hypothetical protein